MDSRYLRLFILMVSIFFVLCAARLIYDNQTNSLRIGIYLIKQNGVVVIESVQPGTPAYEAGIQPFSRFISVNGQKIENWNEVVEALKTDQSEVDILLEHQGQLKNYSVAIGLPPDYQTLFIDIQLALIYLILLVILIPTKKHASNLQSKLLMFIIINAIYSTILYPISPENIFGIEWLNYLYDLLNSIWVVFYGVNYAVMLHLLLLLPQPIKGYQERRNLWLMVIYGFALYLTLATFIYTFSYLETAEETWSLFFTQASFLEILWVIAVFLVLYFQFIQTEKPREIRILSIVLFSWVPMALILLLLNIASLFNIVLPNYFETINSIFRLLFAYGLIVAIKYYNVSTLRNGLQNQLVNYLIVLLSLSYLMSLSDTLLLQMLENTPFETPALIFVAFACGALIYPLSLATIKLFSYSDSNKTNQWWNSCDKVFTATLSYDNNSEVFDNLPRLMTERLQLEWSAVVFVMNGKVHFNFHHTSNNPKNLTQLQLVLQQFADKLPTNSMQISIDHLHSFDHLQPYLLQPLDYSEQRFGFLILGLNDSDQEVEISSLMEGFAFRVSRVLAHNQSRYQATHDGLTNLYRRESIDEKLYTLLKKSNLQLSPVSVVFIDIDHFKQINDRFGHNMGDEVLKQIAGFLAGSLGESAFIGRYGGDEFIVVLPRTETTGAVKLINEVLQKLQQTSFNLNQEQLENISFSAGVSCTKSISGVLDMKTEDLIKLLLAEADKQMYRAKHSGRNQVCGQTETITPATTMLPSETG